MGEIRSKTLYLLTILAVPFVLVAALSGLLVDGIYRDISNSMLMQAYGQDLITLAFGIPVLLGGLVQSFHGSRRGDLLLIGVHGYMAYTYLSYLMLVPFNYLFLVYVAAFSVSFFGCLVGLYQLDARTLKSRFSDDLPRRPIAIFELFVGVVIVFMWLAMIVIPGMVHGELPAFVLNEGGDKLVIQALDLGIIAPLAIASGVLLWRNHRAGYLLSSLVLIKGATLALAVLAMAVFMVQADEYVNTIQIIVFAVFLVGSLAALAYFLRALQWEQDD